MAKEALLKFLEYLDLDFNESRVFLLLTGASQKTILQIAQSTRIPRTTIYRIIEKLEKIGLIEEILLQKKKYFKSVGVHKLEILIKDRENKVEYLKKILPEISNFLPSGDIFSKPGVKIEIVSEKSNIYHFFRQTLIENEDIYFLKYYDFNKFFDSSFLSEYLSEVKNRNIKLHIFGEYSTYNQLSHLEKKHGIEKNIYFRTAPAFSENTNEFYFFTYSNIVSIIYQFENENIVVNISNSFFSESLKNIFKYISSMQNKNLPPSNNINSLEKPN